MSKTSINWVAYRVYYDSNCNGLEEIGYFQNKIQAEAARCKFIEEKKLTETGICCSNSKLVKIEEILIQS